MIDSIPRSIKYNLLIWVKAKLNRYTTAEILISDETYKQTIYMPSSKNFLYPLSSR